MGKIYAVILFLALVSVAPTLYGSQCLKTGDSVSGVVDYFEDRHPADGSVMPITTLSLLDKKMLSIHQGKKGFRY